MAEPSNDSKQLGARIKAAREAARLSQDEFGTRLSAFGHRAASKQTISSWETGRNLPSALVLRDIARVCGVSTDLLLFGEDRWPFDAQLLEKVRTLEPRRLIKLEGAIEMWILEDAPINQIPASGKTAAGVGKRRSLEQAA